MKSKLYIILILIIIASIGLAHFFIQMYQEKYSGEKIKIDIGRIDMLGKRNAYFLNMVDEDSLCNAIQDSSALVQRIKELIIPTSSEPSPNYQYQIIDSKQKEILFSSDSAYHSQLQSSHHKYTFLISRKQKEVLFKYTVVEYFPFESDVIKRRVSSFVYSIILYGSLVFIVFGVVILFLFKQQKIAESKNDYINRMTHEVKTPIASILLAIEALGDNTTPCKPEEAPSFLNIIKKDILRLQELVLQILNQAKKEKTETKLAKGQINLHHIIEEAADAMLLTVTDKEGEIETDLEAANDKILGNSFHLTNIFTNIIENAIKYTPESPLIKVSTHNIGHTIEVRIQDNGVGIAPKDQKKIFKKFYRASDQKNKESFGIGLSYVQFVVKKHKGKIHVESEPGKGSTFVIRFSCIGTA